MWPISWGLSKYTGKLALQRAEEWSSPATVIVSFPNGQYHMLKIKEKMRFVKNKGPEADGSRHIS